MVAMHLSQGDEDGRQHGEHVGLDETNQAVEQQHKDRESEGDYCGACTNSCAKQAGEDEDKQCEN